MTIAEKWQQSVGDHPPEVNKLLRRVFYYGAASALECVGRVQSPEDLSSLAKEIEDFSLDMKEGRA